MASPKTGRYAPPQPQPGTPVYHSPTQEGRKAELTLMIGYTLRRFTCPQTPIQILTTWY